MTKKISLAIVDDHQIVIDGIKSLLKGLDELDVVIECTHPQEMLTLLKQHDVDVLLTDVVMPVMNGADLAKAIRIAYPSIKTSKFFL